LSNLFADRDISVGRAGWRQQTQAQNSPANSTSANFLRAPVATIYEGLILRFKPVNMDVLALYIVLMLVFPPILWVMLRHPHLTLFGSVLLYISARLFGWNLPGYPCGVWYFNPFTWQLLFIFGAWCALGGACKLRPLMPSRAVLVFAIAYLGFALVVTVAGRFGELAHAVNSARPSSMQGVQRAPQEVGA
jgi:hypothetical protein